MILNKVCDLITYKKRKLLANRLNVSLLSTPPPE